MLNRGMLAFPLFHIRPSPISSLSFFFPSRLQEKSPFQIFFIAKLIYDGLFSPVLLLSIYPWIEYPVDGDSTSVVD